MSDLVTLHDALVLVSTLNKRSSAYAFVGVHTHSGMRGPWVNRTYAYVQIKIRESFWE